MLVANGHSWLSIQNYTLSEIGAFFRAVVMSERIRKAEELVLNWRGNNLTSEGLDLVLSSMIVKKEKPPEPTSQEIQRDWNRLATFMSTRK